jgi:hypothetical protein
MVTDRKMGQEEQVGAEVIVLLILVELFTITV